MPANLTPEYRKAEAAYRQAREPREQLECLRVMLRTVPKHKGTDHLQADIKTRIKELTDELAGPKKGATRSGPPTFVHPEGAAQVALLGPPNSGKSALHDRLTGSHAHVGPYPFTTQYAQPGMLPYEDASIQLVDLPPVSPEHPVPWIGNAVQQADGALLVVDFAHPGCLEETVTLHDLLAERKVRLDGVWPSRGPGDVSSAAGTNIRWDDDLFTVHLPTLLVVTKMDLLEDLAAELAVFRDLTALNYPVVTVSSTTGEGLDVLGSWLFDRLRIVRVYTKVPGKAADLGRPFTVRRGDTVLDVARLVHREIAADLKFARLWGGGSFDGQQVGSDHQVSDGDVIELHV